MSAAATEVVVRMLVAQRVQFQLFLVFRVQLELLLQGLLVAQLTNRGILKDKNYNLIYGYQIVSGHEISFGINTQKAASVWLTMLYQLVNILIRKKGH